MKIIGILQPGYLPWLGFFEQMYRSDIFVLYDDVQYDKEGWRNRNRIKTVNGVQWLTVPVLAKFSDHPLISDIRVNNEVNWRKKHLTSITISGLVQPENKMLAFTYALQNYLTNAGISNIPLSYNATNKTLTISNVTLDSQYHQSFSAVISQSDSNVLAISITGNSNQFSRKITANFNCISIGKGVFDYGGPLPPDARQTYQGQR